MLYALDIDDILDIAITVRAYWLRLIIYIGVIYAFDDIIYRNTASQCHAGRALTSPHYYTTH